MKIIKTFALLLSTTIYSLLAPVIGAWYEQKTGIIPFGFYVCSIIFSIIYLILMMFYIWNKKELGIKD